MTTSAPMERCRFTQVGWLMVVLAAILAGVGVLAQAGVLDDAGTVMPVIFYVVAAVLVFLFGWLTVVIREGEIEVRLGVGLIRKRYNLNDFMDVQVVRNRWYWGWGIRFVPGAVLYNVSGLWAVELKRLNGRAVRIGSNRPHELKQALREALNALHVSHPDWKIL